MQSVSDTDSTHFSFFVGDVQGRIDWKDVPRFFGRSIYALPGGYLMVNIGNKAHLMHRLVLEMGPNEIAQVDHIKGDRADNRRSNLRTASPSQNGMNKKARADSQTGIRGVWWDARRQRWCVQICANKKRMAIGRFVSLDEAVDARRRAEDVYHGEFAARLGTDLGRSFEGKP
jgi:HNH endonuclease